MTVNQLHKLLGKLIEKGDGRCRVCVQKDTFSHNCPDCGQECDCECGDRPPEIGCTHDCEPTEPYRDYDDDFA